MSDHADRPKNSPPLSSESDETIRQLFEAYHDRIYQVCLRFMRHEQEAEDITQEVFLKACEAYDRFRGDADPGTWLYRIAVNQCLNRQRQQRRRRWLSLDFWNEADMDTLGEKGRIPGADEQLQAADKERLVREAISRLPDRQRTALILSRYDRLSYQEIAEIMTCSVSSVESLLHRSKLNLARHLRPFLDDL